MLVKEAKEYGSISKGNTKMPGTTYAVDSFACHVGEMLSKKAGSICEQCNMRRLQKIRPLVDKGYKINLEKWQRSIGSIIKWVDAMVFQIKRYCSDGHHRWFDGGDLQSYEMLMAIDSVARQTPQIKHWLPTKEYGIVSKYFKYNTEPENLTIRVSAPMIDGKPSKRFKYTSTVHKINPPQGVECEARKRNNNCGPCRACWDKRIRNISYPKH